MSLADQTNEDFVNCIYVADDGNTYTTSLKRYRQIAGGFTVGVGANGTLPRKFKMRQVHFLNAATGRRVSVPWAEVDAQYTDNALSITIDDTNPWVATGRTGEQQSY